MNKLIVMLVPDIRLYYVYRFKVTTDFYGPAVMRTETLSVVASTYDDALSYIYSLYQKRDNLYSLELLDKTDCIVL